MAENYFSITPRVIAHLGEYLIKDESIALLELIKNSYDAGAKNCIVDFHFENDKLMSIIIQDDGSGMDINTIKNIWLVIGTDFKDEKKRTIQKETDKEKKKEKGRYPLGEKGIGRLGVHKLGNVITMNTKVANGTEIELTINWKKLEKAKSIQEFPIKINDNPKTPQINKHGTILKIDLLKNAWDKTTLKKMYRTITALHSPFSDTSDEFNVTIKTNNPTIFSGLATFEDIKDAALYTGRCVAENNEITEFTYNFKPWSSLEKMQEGRISHLREDDRILQCIKVDPDNERKKTTYYPNLKKAGIGKIIFDIMIFDTNPVIFNWVNGEKTSIKQYLAENGGIRVYRDGIRIYNYGERDNDWLGIDLARVHRVGGNISNNIVLGSVQIIGEESQKLMEKTNREGFVEDGTYFVFQDVVNYILSLFVRERNIDKTRLTELYKENKVIEPVLSDLDDAIELIEKKIHDDVTKQALLDCMSRINLQYKEVKNVLIKSANAGLNLSVVIHEIEKLIKQLLRFANTKQTEQVINTATALEKIIDGYSLMIKKSSIANDNLSKIVTVALENYQFRFTDHKIKVITNHKDVTYFAKYAKSEAISTLINLLDNAIYWLCKSKLKDRAISIYLTDEIEGFFSIVVSDNGPGFNIPADIAVRPFITGKPNNIGSGLGLHIVNEMMTAMKGNLLFLDKADISLPQHIIDLEVDKAIIALCFPKGV